MEDCIKFEFGGLRFYTCCQENQRNEYAEKVKCLNSENFFFLMAFIHNEEIRCRVEAILPKKSLVERAERYNKNFIESGTYLK